MSKNITKADKAELEEASALMTPKQRAFVANLFTPGLSNKDCAVLAGYAEVSAQVEASRLLQNPRILEYMDVCMRHTLKIDAIRARGVVASLSTTAKSDLVKLQAAQDSLDRGGYKPVDKVAHNIQGQLSVSIDLT